MIEDVRPPGTARLLLRPLGYLAIGCVWLAIGLFLLGAYAGLGVAQVLWGADVGPIWEIDGEPMAWGAAALVVVLLAPIAGPAAWYLGCASWPLAALSSVYVLRAVRPSYRGEELSFTSYAAPGTTLGPPTATNVSLSLQPVRRSGVTDVLMRFYVCGWQPDVRDVAATLPAGFGWAAATVAASPFLAPGVRALLVAVALVLYGATAVLLRRRWVWRFHRERPRPGRRERTVAQFDGSGGPVLRDGPRVVRSRPQSAAHREHVEVERARARQETEPLTALTSDAIGERRERALRARERRLREQGRADG
jgi:hypothetical protein